MKQKAGKQHRGPLVYPYQVLPRHTSQDEDPESQGAREEPRARVEKGHAPTPAICLGENRKKKKITSQTAPKLGCLGRSRDGAVRATSSFLTLSAGDGPARSRHQPIARRPASGDVAGNRARRRRASGLQLLDPAACLSSAAVPVAPIP